LKCPCKGCEKRTLTCHGFCQEYKAWKAEHQAEKDWLQKQNLLEISDSVMKKHWRNLRSNRRRKPKSGKEY